MSCEPANGDPLLIGIFLARMQIIICPASIFYSTDIPFVSTAIIFDCRLSFLAQFFYPNQHTP